LPKRQAGQYNRFKKWSANHLDFQLLTIMNILSLDLMGRWYSRQYRHQGGSVHFEFVSSEEI
jgi:hypothetical protein